MACRLRGQVSLVRLDEHAELGVEDHRGVVRLPANDVELVERVALVGLVVVDQRRLERTVGTSQLDRADALLTHDPASVTREGRVVGEGLGVVGHDDLDVEQLADLTVEDLLFVRVLTDAFPDTGGFLTDVVSLTR